MNAYFICVVVHVQMWCVICGSNQKDFFFVLFVCFWKWFVSPMFFKVFQVVFVWKSCFLGVFMTHFICKLNWELNGPILKFFFFSFGQRVSLLFCDCFVSKAYQWNTSEIPAKFSREANQRDTSENFQISFLKGISWVICFKRLPSSPKPLF